MNSFLRVFGLFELKDLSISYTECIHGDQKWQLIRYCRHPKSGIMIQDSEFDDITNIEQEFDVGDSIVVPTLIP